MNGLLFITHQTDKYDYLHSIEIVLKGGCRQVQLRMKDKALEEITKTAIKAKELCEQYGADLYINDHPQVCKHIGAYGLHLGKNDMSPELAREIVGPDCVIGGTANTFEDIYRLWKAGVDYIGLGPFRFTATKKNLSPVLGLEGYEHIMAKCRERGINLPVLAIGGITPSDIPSLMNTGISGIALSSTILRAEDPVEITKQINNTLKIYL